MNGTKLDGRSKIRRWIGFEEISNGHRVYWPDKHSLTVGCSIKFANDDVIIPSILIAKPIQGENTPMGKDLNLQHDLETKLETPYHELENQELTDHHHQNSKKSIASPTKMDTSTSQHFYITR